MKVLKIIFSAVLAAGGMFTLSASSPGDPPPNILFLAMDDMKPALGNYGYDQIATPAIDRIAEQGVSFMRAYCQKAVCGPSRSSLLTGLRPDNNRVWNLSTQIRDIHPDIITLPQYFKINGYETAAIGKIFDPRNVDDGHDALSWSHTYIAPSKHPLAEGYDKPYYGHYQSAEVWDSVAILYDEAAAEGLSGSAADDYVKERLKPATECASVPDDAYKDGAFTMEALRKIEGFEGNQPFFLAVGFKKPHLPFVAPKKYWDLYSRGDLRTAEFQDMAQGSPLEAYDLSSELLGYTDITDFGTYDGYELDGLEDSLQLELIHGYYACVSYIDAQIGMILDALEDRGMLENTIVVLWGDHGFHLGDHGQWGKHTNFEEATHSPLIISVPGYSGDRQTKALVEFVDLYPTLADLAGLGVPTGLDGSSLKNILESPWERHKAFAVSQYRRNGLTGYSLRSDRYRYTEWHDIEQGAPGYDSLNVVASELYDYLEDSLETINFYGDDKYRDKLSSLHEQMKEFLETGTVPLITSGLQKVQDENITVYPNPFNEGFTLSLPENSGQKQLVRIFNSGGVLIHQELIGSKRTIYPGINDSGVYFLDVGGASKKIIKE